MRLDDGTLRVFAAFATRTLARPLEPRAVQRDRDPPGPRRDRAFGIHRPCALATDEFPAPTGSADSRNQQVTAPNRVSGNHRIRGMRSFASDDARDACATVGSVLMTDPGAGPSFTMR